jgi:hypothetical protein
MTITGLVMEGFGNQAEVETTFRIRSPFASSERHTSFWLEAIWLC